MGCRVARVALSRFVVCLGVMARGLEAIWPCLMREMLLLVESLHGEKTVSYERQAQSCLLLRCGGLGSCVTIMGARDARCDYWKFVMRASRG